MAPKMFARISGLTLRMASTLDGRKSTMSRVAMLLSWITDTMVQLAIAALEQDQESFLAIIHLTRMCHLHQHGTKVVGSMPSTETPSQHLLMFRIRL